jgi:DNA-binding MarR family transcriptional regulator
MVLRQHCAQQLVAVLPYWIRELRREMRRAAPEGLSVPLFRALIFAGGHPGESLGALAAHLGVTLPTASVAVDKLIRAGYLLPSKVGAGAGRRHELHLSETGSAAVEQAMCHTVAAFSERLASWTPEQLSGLDATLALLGEGFDAQPGSLVARSRPHQHPIDDPAVASRS